MKSHIINTHLCKWLECQSLWWEALGMHRSRRTAQAIRSCLTLNYLQLGVLKERGHPRMLGAGGMGDVPFIFLLTSEARIMAKSLRQKNE